MTFIIIYYAVGLLIASAISFACHKVLGKEGIYAIYKGDYPDTELSITEVNVYTYIAAFLIIPVVHGYFILKLSVEVLDKGFKKIWRKCIVQGKN